MRTPSSLQKGDQIGIIACAGRIAEERIRAGIQVLESWGLSVCLGKYLFTPHHQFGATDSQRLEDLQEMLDNPEIKAVISARGGYGTVRIIDGLNFSRFIEQPKWLIGFSDLTVLHAHVNRNCGIETLHAQMLAQFPDNVLVIEQLRKIIFGDKLSYSFTAPESMRGLLRTGEASGQLTGGNLTLLHSLSGSISDQNTDGKILFIEDLNEQLYHLDRMMNWMKRSGKLSKLKGLLVGGFTTMKDGDIPFGKIAEEIITDAVREYEYPVYVGFPAGHIPTNYPLIMGRKATIKVDETGIVMKF